MTEFPTTKSQLLVQVRSGENREAWERFVLIYRPVIYRMARRRGMRDADAQDVAQNVLARVAGALEQYERKPGSRFRHWLRRVAKNAILTTLSRLPQDPAQGGSAIQNLLAAQPDGTLDVEQELANEYMREQFLRAAAIVRTDVSPEMWKAFELTLILGNSNESAARELGKTVGTVYAARSRIMKRLRDQVERMKEGDE